MKTVAYIIWFSVFLLVYGSVNYYIGLRGYQALIRNQVAGRIYIAVFIFLTVSYFSSRILENITVCGPSSALFWIGSFWFGFMLYFFLAAAFFDIIRLVNYIFDFYPAFIKNNYDIFKLITAACVVSVTAVVQIYGFANARGFNISELDLNIPKNAGSLKEVRIAFVSDIHLGTINKNARLEKMVAAANGIKPDLVILGGDVFDEDLKPVLHYNMGYILKNLKARFGVYAICGNHEYYGGVDEAAAYLDDHGIKMLRDMTVKINNSFYLAGADDRTKRQFTGVAPAPFDVLLKDADGKLPVILAVHNPNRVEEAARSGADIMISGHTHNGQLWPLKYVTAMIYQLSCGYRKIGSTHAYVSSGFGTWGPPVRIGTTSEIVSIRLQFTGGE